jgi:hypothetical protein
MEVDELLMLSISISSVLAINVDMHGPELLI